MRALLAELNAHDLELYEFVRALHRRRAAACLGPPKVEIGCQIVFA